MDTDEQPLVDRARAGDRDAFRRLVEAHSPRALRIAWRITGDQQLAEDAVQEAFLGAWRRLDRFRGDSRFGTWLHRITVNAALGLVRKRKRNREDVVEDSMESNGTRTVENQPAHSAAPEQLLQRHELGRATRSALKGLSELERTAFVMRHFEEMSIREIGLAMNASEGTVKQALFRAVRKVRTALEPVVMRHETA